MDPSEIEVVLAEAGVVITRTTDDEVYAHCPNPEHPDRNASWSMNTETLAHYCFACGYRGNLEMLLRDRTGKAPGNVSDIIRRAKVARLKAKTKEPEQEPEIFVSEWQLNEYEHVPGWACDERSLDPHIVDEFGVRWDHRTEHWIIPVRAFDGKLLGWQEKGDRFFRNVPTGMEKSKSLFGYDLLDGEAILVESPLDVIRMETVGVVGGTASYGAAVSDDQMRAIIAKVDTLILALDHDDAGRKSMVALIEKWRLSLRMKIVRYRRSDPKDVGEMSGPMIRRLISNACDVTRGRRVSR